MGGLLSKHKAKTKDYERVLLELEMRIRQSEEKIAAIKTRESAVHRRVLSYGFVLCILSGLFSCIHIVGASSLAMYDYAACLCPVVMILVGMIYARRIVHYFFRRRMKREGIRLSDLRSKLNVQLEELKNKTAYNATLALLKRYDPAAADEIKAAHQDAAEGGSSSSISREALRHKLRGQHQDSNPDSKVVHQQYLPPVIQHPQSPSRPTKPAVPQEAPPSAPQPDEHNLLRWYFKFIDRLVGVNEVSEKEYALICNHCFGHNGLFLKDEIDHIHYTCAYCKQFNDRRDERIDGLSSTSSSEDTDSMFDESDELKEER